MVDHQVFFVVFKFLKQNINSAIFNFLFSVLFVELNEDNSYRNQQNSEQHLPDDRDNHRVVFCSVFEACISQVVETCEVELQVDFKSDSHDNIKEKVFLEPHKLFDYK